MEPTFAGQLDALAGWRRAVDRRLTDLARFLGDHELIENHGIVESVRERLASDRLVVAFVAEFSRGKSELINAIFFADTGRRILPATPGRTTMCPVELSCTQGEPPQLSLLPIDSRLDGHSLAEMRARTDAWTRVRLDAASPDKLAEAMSEVMRTKAVTLREARALGFWHDDRPDDNPPLIAEGLVEVPAWRHAVVNYPHPLLRRGLVVLDTPGLNAIGAEPELTLSLLPAAHALVFILGADTGVTKSDLTMWRDHLGAQSVARYVVLNKIDTLVDPLLDAAQVSAQIDRQRRDSAATLGVSIDKVFPLSARQALAARIDGQRMALTASRLPELEAALANELLPRRREVLVQTVLESAGQLQAHALRRLNDQRRQLSEQMLELRGLRGKSGGKVTLMLRRVDQETAEFERCTARLTALRSVHLRIERDTLEALASEKLRDQVAQMQRDIAATMFNLGAKKAFSQLCTRLRARVAGAIAKLEETHEMLNASFLQLNGDYGFALALVKPPALSNYMSEIDTLEANYGQYLGLSNAIKLSEPRFMEQLRRMLLSKLRIVFENASSDVELWNKAATSQVDAQLRERRRGFKRRREALERIQEAAGELEQRIGEIEAHDERLRGLQAGLMNAVDAVRAEAAREPEADGASRPMPLAREVPGSAERDPPTLTLVLPRGAERAA